MVKEYIIYLDSDMREKLLRYDIEHSEQNYDNLMWYICNSEKEILHNILVGLNWYVLEQLGFSEEDSRLIFNRDVNQFYVEFTNNNVYFIKEVN